ncbi:hypothetical protein [Sphingomonas cavernae]|uniref:hypothetical protein n=1 Tax=Sphingomonas cavernae TaxID=2320861 RepID=UPI0011C35E3B|nr:hypothetical protein [Sphingomonas cavernae]
MLPENGRVFPNGRNNVTEAEYIGRISQALRDELGATRAAAKTIMKWTGASDHTARNWINGVTGPNGHHLAALAHHSDAVLAAMLGMSERQELLLSLDIHAAEVALAKAIGALEMLKRQAIAKSKNV